MRTAAPRTSLRARLRCTNMPRIRPPVAALAALLAALAAAAVALGALPARDARLEAHDHETKGRNWHVQLEVGKDRRRIDTVVAYSEQCGETLVQTGVAVAEDGAFAAGGPTKKGGGSWEATGRFTAARVAEGTFRMRKGKCDTGALPFKATAGSHAGHGDGHEGHDHEHKGSKTGGHGAHHGRKYPRLGAATPAQRGQAKALHRQVRRMARERFPTYEAAKRLGYERFNRKWGLPVVFHLRHRGYGTDGILLRASRPESLVYWWPRRGKPVLIGFMFRVPAGTRPAFAGPIPIYHGHPRPGGGGRGPTQMTHVWLTRDLRTAWANCLPARQLEKELRRFRYRKQGNGNSGPEARPCQKMG